MSSRLLGEVASTTHGAEQSRAAEFQVLPTSYRPHPWRLQVWYPVRDCIAIYLTVLACFLLFASTAWTGDAFHSAALIFLKSGLFGYSFAYSVFLVLTLKRACYYIPLPVNSLFDEAILVFKSIAFSVMALFSALYVGGYSVHGSRWLFTARVMRSSDLARGVAAGPLARNALIIGNGEVGKALANHLEKNPNLGYVVKGFLDDQDDKDPLCLGKHADLYRVIQRHFIDEVFITTLMQRDLIKRLTMQAPEYRVNVTVVPDLYDGIGWHTPVSRIGHLPVMILHREDVHYFQLFLKRVMDLVGAAVGLVLLSPLMLAIAAAIKWNSPGPILYRARRVGKKGMMFDCLKFRTMQDGADKLLDKLAHLNEREGPLFKAANDPRVTALGRFLRRYSLDELPQFFNVLKGEMSLVGPRPPALQEYMQYRLEHLRKLEVMPGMTGLWQICSRQDPSFESYIKCDLEYIENWSVWMDLVILGRTIPVVFSGTGS
jgi:exopolysaccharide biosynthesis polyprenyl glycosylphosphotransferase